MVDEASSRKPPAMSDTDAILARLDELQTSFDALVRSLSLMNDTLGTHSEMLAQILEAATKEPDEANCWRRRSRRSSGPSPPKPKRW